MMSRNPFVVIIVTAWEKSTGLINKVVSSGADDLLLRPFSTAQLGVRIESHVDRRKNFVITTDYVGPDRRKDTNRASNAELFEPPNSLKAILGVESPLAPASGKSDLAALLELTAPRAYYLSTWLPSALSSGR